MAIKIRYDVFLESNKPYAHYGEEEFTTWAKNDEDLLQVMNELFPEWKGLKIGYAIDEYGYKLSVEL